MKTNMKTNGFIDYQRVHTAATSHLSTLPRLCRLRLALRRIAHANKLLQPLPSGAFFLNIALMLLCAADAVMTLQILAKGGVEVNPFMASMLDQGLHQFISFKIALTALSTLLLVSIGFEQRVFGRFNVSAILRVATGLYIMLIIYEFILLTIVI